MTPIARSESALQLASRRLGDHPARTHPQGRYRADDRQIAGLVPSGDKPGVDLEHVDRQGLQVRQQRVAGAEVVDSDCTPTSLSPASVLRVVSIS